MNSVMKAWSVIGLLFAAAIFATTPISPQLTQRGVEVSVDQAQAVTNRRRLRRGSAILPWAAVLGRPWAYRRADYVASAGYYYGAPSYYYGGYGGYGGYYNRQPVGGGGGQFYCSVYDPRCWY